MCLGDISKEFTVTNVKTRLNGYAYGFSFDNNTIGDIHIYLMKNYDMIHKNVLIYQKDILLIELLCICIKERLGEVLVSNSEGSIKCGSLNNRLCQAWLTLVNISSINYFFIHSLSLLIIDVLHEVKIWMQINFRGKWNKAFSLGWIVRVYMKI